MIINNWHFEYVCEITLKSNSDGNPKEFLPQKRYENKKNLPLNRYGKGPFCKFSVDKYYAQRSGAYVIYINGNIPYVGECDDFQKRFGMGYGNISPKNCFQGGQPTNCRINSNILQMIKSGKKIQLYFFETRNRFKVEYELIKKLKPIWNKTKGKPSKITKYPEQKRIYLDTKEWIYLSRLHHGLEKNPDPELVKIYQKIIKLSRYRKVIFQTSITHLKYTMMNRHGPNRNKLINFIMKTSKEYVLHRYNYDIPYEIVNAILHMPRKASVCDIKSNILSQGLVHIVGDETEMVWSKNVADVPDQLIQKIKDAAGKPENMIRFLKDDKMSEWFQEDRKSFYKAVKNVEQNRLEKPESDKSRCYNQNLAHYIYDIICPYLPTLLVGSDEETKKRVLPQDKEEMEKFLKDMSCNKFSFRFRDERGRGHQGESSTKNFTDIYYLAGGIASCDIVVTEKTLASLARQLRLDKRYDCTIIHSLKELNKII